MADGKPKRGSLLKDSSIYLSATGVSTAISFFTLPIYTRYLSPSDYGIVALFMMFGGISSGLLSVGLQAASYRYYFQYKEDREEYKILNSSNFLFLIFVYLLAGICIYHLAGWFSSALFDGRISPRLIRLSFLSGCMGYFFAYLTLLLAAQTRSMTFSIVTISQFLLETGFSFYFIFIHSLTYLAKIYAILLTQGIMIACLMILTRDLFGIRFSFRSLKRSLLFSYPLTPRSLIGLVYSSFDKIMLNKYTGLTSVGYYTFGAKFANLVKMATDSVGRAWTPFFMNKAHENSQEAQNTIIRHFYEIAFFFMLVGLGIIYFSEEMIILLTTKEFYPSMYVVPIYVYFRLFAIIDLLAVNQVLFAEKMQYRLFASIISVVLNIILNILLIPEYGAIGAAIATAIAAFGSSISCLYFGQRVYPLPVRFRKLVDMFILFIAFTLPVYPIMIADMNFIVKIILKIIIILVFVGLGFKLSYVSRESRNMLLNKLVRQGGYS